jgi:predicted NAD-dependent protein-ADP-ribosyltransferase YbiA (DUF1768 family)
MQDLVIQKFSTPEFSKMLLSTGDKYLEETNHWGDTFWGKSGGIGENKLGQILMEIRKMLRELPGA